MKRLREPEDDGDALARKKSPPQSAQSLFEHSPLDLKSPSIRLVRILPNFSSDGHVQLEVRHASTKSAYICLSYVWGHGRNLPWIRLDGRLFQVRQNLHAFLASARKKPHVCSEWLWIDALCIDQSNTPERSHQVQQMGHIFSRAVKVISWLGDFEGIARFFRESKPPLRLHVSAPEHLNPFPLHFFQSEYWTRAWITQELSLARKITFMAGKEEIDRWQPPEEAEDKPVVPWVFRPYKVKDYYFLGNRSHQGRDRSLIYLLYIYSRKECWDPRDRIFSLLALCGEGSNLDVDYDISHDALAKRVLRVGADADLVEAHQEPVLRMSSDSDHYTDAPDVSLPAPDEPLRPSLQSLRSFQVRPYLNNDCQPRYCGVFVYDWEDNKVASRGLSAELFRTSSLPSALDFIE
ncbi:unnamed protein product [Alternaria alternata]